MEKHLLDYFSKAIHYVPALGTGNRCKSLSKLPSQPQVTINVLFKYLIENPIQRGMLVWHTTGSGKTCSAAAVIEAYFYTHKHIVFATSVEALRANPPAAFYECLTKYFDSMKELTFHDFEKRVKFFTFAQLSHYLLISRALKNNGNRELLKDAVLIVDEVHNLFRPLPHQKAEHEALYEFLANYTNPFTEFLQLAIFTATPGDTPSEIVKLLNLVRRRDKEPITIPSTPSEYVQFAKKIEGLISYFDISQDLTRFPKVIQEKTQILPMHMRQYRRYVQAIDEMKPIYKNYEALAANNLLDKFLRPARKYANMLHTLETGMALHEFSSKLPKLIETIKKYPNEKHYIYSTFFENHGFGGHGIRAIAKILEKELRFKEAKPGECETKAVRYMMALGTTKGLNKLITEFNAPRNTYGEYIRVMLASQKYNEGLDLKAIRHIHILEPMISYNKELQTIGRGARYCSHQELHKLQWTIKVHRYIADFPSTIMDHDPQRLQSEITWLENAITGSKNPEEIAMYREKLRKLIRQVKQDAKMNPETHPMVDDYMTKMMTERVKETLVLLQIMREHSVDCQLYSNYHGIICKNNLRIE